MTCQASTRSKVSAINPVRTVDALAGGLLGINADAASRVESRNLPVEVLGLSANPGVTDEKRGGGRAHGWRLLVRLETTLGRRRTL